MIQVLRETHEPPAWAEQILRNAGGINRYGEPNFRVVFGWNRLTWIGGRWTDRDDSGNITRQIVEMRQEPKYPAVNRWNLERWMPPETYGTREQWYEATIKSGDSDGPYACFMAELGPYPERGEYEHAFTIEDVDGNFLQLSASVIAHVARAIEFSRGLRNVDRKHALAQRTAKEEKDYDSFADTVLSDTNQLAGKAYVTV